MRPGSTELSMRFCTLQWTSNAALAAGFAAGNHQPFSRRPSRLLNATSSYVAWTYAGVFFSGSRVTRVTPSAYFHEMPTYETATTSTRTNADRNAHRMAGL